MTRIKKDPASLFRARTILVLLLSGALSACGSSQQKDSGEVSEGRRAAEVNTQLGTEYFNRGQYEVSLEKLKKAVSSDKSYAPAHMMLGILYEQLGDFDKADKELKTAVDLTPDKGDVNNNYGAFLCRNGRSAESYPYFMAALEDPFYSTPYVAMGNAGNCAMEENNLSMAESYLRRALNYNAQFPDALLSLAQVEYRKGEPLTARAFVQRYEAVASPTAESLMTGYLVETELNNDKGAERYRRLVLERFPESAQAQTLKRSMRR